MLDFSTFLAAPFCARTLGEYGAEVIKIDIPEPHAGPAAYCWLATEVGQGKQSILLDLKKNQGKEILKKLINSADIIVHNFRPGVAKSVGLDYESNHSLSEPVSVVLDLDNFSNFSFQPYSALFVAILNTLP